MVCLRAPRQDTGDTRESPAIDVCKGLIGDGAKLNIYDPQVSEKLMLSDLSTPKFEWDHPASRQAASAVVESQVVPPCIKNSSLSCRCIWIAPNNFLYV